MHGMLSAAIILVVFALVAVVGGGSAETGSVAPDPTASVAPEDGTVADTRGDLPAPDLGPDDELDDESAAEPDDEEFEGARIYLLDSYPRSGR